MGGGSVSQSKKDMQTVIPQLYCTRGDAEIGRPWGHEAL